MTNGAGGGTARPLRVVPVVRHSRDPRPIGDKGFATQCARNIVELLVSHGFGKTISHEKLLKDPSTRDFFEIFRFLMGQIDPRFEMEGKLEDEVPVIMRRLKYPVEVNRSKLQAISGPNTWPQLLAVLDWLVMLVRITTDLIEPVALCELGLSDAGDAEHDIADHQLLQSLHENYVQYLGNNDENADEERLRHVYEERLAALRGEIERLQTQHEGMDVRLHDLRTEHERFLELQREPALLELEAEKLRGTIQCTEAQVQQLEHEISLAEADEGTCCCDLDDLQSTIHRLMEQVEKQAYSKKDIERLKCERSQLKHVHQDLRTDLEKVDQEIWELGMKESNWMEAIGRVLRMVNECVECLGTKHEEFAVQMHFEGTGDALAMQDFEALCRAVQDFTASRAECSQVEEAALHSVHDDQRVVQEGLSERERECRRLKVRLEQLNKMREEYREWSAEQLDDAQRTAEATEDAVHAVAIGAPTPSLRDAAEVDSLRIKLNGERIRFANEKAQLQEQIHRDDERFEDERLRIIQELDAYARVTKELLDDAEASIDGECTVYGLQFSARSGHLGGS